MNESARVIEQFRIKKRLEENCSGQKLAVCVAGWVSYAELRGALGMKYKGIMRETKNWNGWIEFEGVKIYPSQSFEEGFFFGHIEESPQLHEKHI